MTAPTPAPDASLPDLYTALAEIEGKIAAQQDIVQDARSTLGDAMSALDGLKATRSDLHKAIRAKKARAKPSNKATVQEVADIVNGRTGNADPAMPAHLRRGT